MNLNWLMHYTIAHYTKSSRKTFGLERERNPLRKIANYLKLLNNVDLERVTGLKPAAFALARRRSIN
jgi:hypothetical protein